jgi:hypothetical protein
MFRRVPQVVNDRDGQLRVDQRVTLKRASVLRAPLFQVVFQLGDAGDYVFGSILSIRSGATKADRQRGRSIVVFDNLLRDRRIVSMRDRSESRVHLFDPEFEFRAGHASPRPPKGATSTWSTLPSAEWRLWLVTKDQSLIFPTSIDASWTSAVSGGPPSVGVANVQRCSGSGGTCWRIQWLPTAPYEEHPTGGKSSGADSGTVVIARPHSPFGKQQPGRGNP